MANGWGGARPNSGPKKKAAANDNRAKTKKPASAAAAEPKPKRAALGTEAILELIRQSQESARNRPRSEEWNPYKIRPELFGPVAKKIPKRLTMAMDNALMSSNQIAIQAWQAGGLLGNVVSEGLLFLGYPYLAELAQRPEYRLFGEIRAQEMTRKWIKFRGIEDESTKEKKTDNDRDEDDQARDFAGPDDEPRTGVAKNKPARSDGRNKEIEEKIRELTDFAEELRLRDWFQAAAAQDSFFGISHLYLDMKGADVENINDPELKMDIGNGRDGVTEAKLKGKKGFLRGMRTIEPLWAYPTTYNAQNPLIPSWYDPQQWYVMGTEIHKSRFLTFIGRPVPDILKPAYAFGGLSMTQMAQPYVNIWLKIRESVGELVHAYSVMVLKTNMATTTMPGGSGGGAGDVLARLALFANFRDNQGVFAVDNETEDFMNVSAPLSGIDELQAQAQEHMFSVGRIPAVKFAGIQPKGLNATSEGEIRAFYDTVLGEQNHLFRPNLQSATDLMQYSLWGDRDPDITFDFVPLWELTEKEKSEKRKADAEVDTMYVDGGILSQEEVRTRVANDPESGYDSIDPDDVPELLKEEEMGLEPMGGRPQPQAKVGEEEEGNEVDIGGDGGIQNFDADVEEQREESDVTNGG
jgi:uncharacterized protein